MTDFIEHAVAITPDQITANNKKVESFQQAKVRDQRWLLRVAIVIASTFFVTTVGLVGVIASLAPNINRGVPTFIQRSSIGTWQTTSSIEDLSPSDHVSLVQQTLWEYVRRREHYSFGESAEDYDIIVAMSAQQVADQYSKYFNANNSNSPQNVYKKSGFVRVKRLGAEFLKHSSDYNSGVWHVTFERTSSVDGSRITVQTMTATVTYITSDSVPVWGRVRYDAGRIVITEYPGAEGI